MALMVSPARTVTISIHAPRMGSDDGTRRTVTRPGLISIHAPRMGSDATKTLDHSPSLSISIHAPRMGSDTATELDSMYKDAFQSTLPGWGATHHVTVTVGFAGISIHAPRMGSDAAAIEALSKALDFNPRSPDGERQSMGENADKEMKFQSTLPGWGATWRSTGKGPPYVFQSTLPGWGATLKLTPGNQTQVYFNPRSPDGERLQCGVGGPFRPYFNPRSPDGERRTRHPRPADRHDFNPRSPDGERLFRVVSTMSEMFISIHAPRMGSDRATRGEITNNHPFQSTLPGWGATSLPLDNLSQAQRISIHAPRMGSDWYTSR